MVVTGTDRPPGAALADRLEAGGVPVRRDGELPGARALAHLAAPRDPAAPDRRDGVVGGTAEVLEAARAAGVRRVVLVTSAEVLAARPGQLPVAEDGPLRAVDDGSLVSDWLEVERLADHARRTGLDVVVLRPAALTGAGPSDDGAALRQLSERRLLAVRGVEPLWQLCHADDLVAAAALAATTALAGPCAVASDGWLPQWRVEQLAGVRRLELPAAVALSTAERLHRLGISTGSPSELDGLLTPVVVEPARLRAAGWTPGWTTEAALSVHLAAAGPAGPPGRASTYAAGAAGATAAMVGTAALVRRARRRRRL